MSYPGGKGGAGVYQAIINQMPPHDVYIEPFLGFGTILKRKRPAPIASIGIDADADVALARTGDTAGATIIHGDALHWLQQREHWTGRELVYADPPYPRASRRSPSRLYRENTASSTT
jgi:DNA adenine methylase